jgi:hypothetical protein
MIVLTLTWLLMAELVAVPQPPPRVDVPAVQASSPLRLDIRVFDGTTDVTDDTVVSIYDAGTRVTPRRLPQAANGERQMALPPGQYDLQLIHQDDGRVRAVRWTTLRLLVDYPGEHGRHLEVINLRPGFGALQVRRAGMPAEDGRVPWSATLHEAGRREPVLNAVPGDGYLLFVAPPGRYDVEVRTPAGTTHRIRDAEIREDLTYLKSWR